MRILILTPWFPHYPEEQQGNFILDSVNSLIEMGHDVKILVTKTWKPTRPQRIEVEKFHHSLQIQSCRYFSIPRHFFSPISFWSYKKIVGRCLTKIIKQHNIQLIHAHTEYAGMAAVKVGKALGVPTIVTVHGVSTDKKLYVGMTQKQLFKEPFTQASRVVLVGSSLKSFVSQFVNHMHHIAVIANGFRTSVHNSTMIKKNWTANHKCFISVSNLEEGKGIDINLHALAKLKQIGMHAWTYTIVGDGSQRQSLERLCQQYELTSHVTFLGAVDHKAVYEHLSKADIFILPSYREAFGVAYLEAMSCGLLTIGVENQGPQDFISHGKTGFLVKPKNVEHLVLVLKQVFQEQDAVAVIAAAGQAYIHQHFTWRHHAKHLTQLYHDVLTKD